jgi:hypothetical protein
MTRRNSKADGKPHAIVGRCPLRRLDSPLRAICKSYRSYPVELCRQGFQQDAIALDRLTDMQTALNFPDARRRRLHDRNAEILLQSRDDTEASKGDPKM